MSPKTTIHERDFGALRARESPEQPRIAYGPFVSSPAPQRCASLSRTEVDTKLFLLGHFFSA